MRTGMNALQATVATFSASPLAQAVKALNWQHSITPIAAAQSVDDETLAVSVPSYTPDSAILCNLQALNPQVVYEQTGLTLKEPHRCTFDVAYVPLFVVGSRMRDSRAVYEVASAGSATEQNALLACGDYAEAILERLFWL